MTRTIYIVKGATGEYSDYTEWLVKAFHDENSAEDYVDFLTKTRKKLPARREGLYAKITKAMIPFDPNFQEDYTGTRWYVESVELVE